MPLISTLNYCEVKIALWLKKKTVSDFIIWKFCNRVPVSLPAHTSTLSTLLSQQIIVSSCQIINAIINSANHQFLDVSTMATALLRFPSLSLIQNVFIFVVKLPFTLASCVERKFPFKLKSYWHFHEFIALQIVKLMCFSFHRLPRTTIEYSSNKKISFHYFKPNKVLYRPVFFLFFPTRRHVVENSTIVDTVTMRMRTITSIGKR